MPEMEMGKCEGEECEEAPEQECQYKKSNTVGLIGIAGLVIGVIVAILAFLGVWGLEPWNYMSYDLYIWAVPLAIGVICLVWYYLYADKNPHCFVSGEATDADVEFVETPA